MSDIVVGFLRTIRIAEGNFAFIDVLGDHGILIQPSNQIMFHLVLAGQPLLSDDRGRETSLAVGDFVFAMRDQAHTIRLPYATALERISYFDSSHKIDIPNSLVLGRGAAGTKLLSGALTLDLATSQTFLKMVPSLLIMNSQNSCMRLDQNRAFQLSRSLRTPGSAVFLTKLVELYLIDALRNCTANLTLLHEGPVGRVRTAAKIMSAVQIMANEREKHWSLASLASRVGMSRSAFAVAFHRAVGQTPLVYLTELRMQRAVELLRAENLPIKDICGRVGYETEIAFARVFKKFAGITAGEYRRLERNAKKKYAAALDHWSDFVDGHGS